MDMNATDFVKIKLLLRRKSIVACNDEQSVVSKLFFIALNRSRVSCDQWHWLTPLGESGGQDYRGTVSHQIAPIDSVF